MVQRKEPTKLKPKTKPVSKPQSFDLHGSPVSKGTASSTDHSKKKTMKYLPNYMKPTTSSDARKDHQFQVTHHDNSPSIANSSRKSNPRSSSPPSVTSKRKALTPFLKRTKSKVLFQKLNLNLNRATCSSTLKDSKFPKALGLNPGGTELEGTSVVRVCPYTYCSLNGHVHEPMPPLKSFLASKRKLIKTQQSMKLKGFSPFRKREPKRSEKEVSPLFQEVVNDFIVEIYASTKEKIVDPVKTEERTAIECRDIRREEEEAVSTAALDRKSDFSLEEMDAMVKLVEFVSCDQEVEAISRKCSDLVVEEAGEENSIGFDDNCTKFESFKEFDADFMEDLDVFSDSESFSSERTDGGLDQSHDQLSELKEEPVVEEMHLRVASESEIQNQMAVNTMEEGVEEAKEDEKSNSMVGLEESDDCTEPGVVSERKDEEVLETESSDCSDNGIPSHLLENLHDQKLDSMVDLGDNVNSLESEVVSEGGEEKLADFSEHEIATQVFENSSQEKGDEEEEEESKIQEVENPNSILELEEEEEEESHQEEETEISGTELDCANEEETNPEEPQEDVIGTGIEGDELQAVENPTCTETELDHEIERPDPNQPKEEEVATETSQIDQLCVAFGEMHIEGEDYSFDPTCQQKNRLIIARRRPMSGEDEYMRGFNPRGPNFLPVVPDPESEKVDLRHQMMDERKNAEEWMLDYALQKAVNQLAPARKKKVELLVAAFETVVPVVPVRGGGVTCS